MTLASRRLLRESITSFIPFMTDGAVKFIYFKLRNRITWNNERARVLRNHYCVEYCELVDLV